MNSVELFKMALGLQTPWYVEKVEFTNKSKNVRELNIHIEFTKGAKFKDTKGVDSCVHDTVKRTWQHLNFFEHHCYIHARIPRIRTSDSKIQNVEVPWARANSGFTLLFEAFAMLLIENEMPVNKAAGILKVYPKRLWTMFNYWVTLALSKDKQSSVTAIGIDETSRKKGHDYVTVAVDLNEKRVLFVTEGKDEKTIDRLKEHFDDKSVLPEQIKQVSIDMSPAFIAGISNNFPEAEITFDRFHIVKLLNEAMDKVRKDERRDHEQLKGHKYTFLKSNDHLSERQQKEREELIDLYPKLGQAYCLKELFNDFWAFSDFEEAVSFLAYWCDLVEDASIAHFKKFVNTLNSHWNGVINYIKSK
ncbi:ISL3 family transposase, partial [Phenylobacterium sp.]|uniref:ISL3 family transposase n=1 Tax=Phenylobacterium sp. TaxID=1871053 RepID=UPI00273643F3